MKTYWIDVRHERKWLFFLGDIVYDVMQEYEVWEDPTYGNGGGDWVKKSRRIKTFPNTVDAINYRDRMNKLEEGNHDVRN